MTDRDEKGQFLPGNKASPGRPARTTETQYLRSLAAVCTLAEWEEIAGAVVAKAKNGDMGAVNWLAKYLLGNPAATVPNLAKAHALEVEEVDEIGDAVRNVQRAKMFDLL